MSTIDETFASTVQGLGLTEKPEAVKERTKLGQADFLKLMITEIQNQDPFKPVENSDFVAQMAQFSSVSGLEQLQTSFSQLATSMSSNQALQASTMVGRTVSVSSGDIVLGGSGNASGAVSLGTSSLNVVVNVLNDAGEIVKGIELGPQAAGNIPFKWDGTGSDGFRVPAGRYHLSAEARGLETTTGLATYVDADVESVTLNQNGQGITLNLKELGSADFSRVREIK